MRNVVFIALVFVCLQVSASAQPAEICETVNDVSNLWNEVANFLDDHSDTGIDADAADELDELIDALDDPTRTLGDALVEHGNETEEALGDRLLGQLDALSDRERGDTVSSLVEIIDSAVDTLDSIVDYCDSVTQ